jgi:hypothetical protein
VNRSEELRKHAIECGQMANLLRTKENRAAWNSHHAVQRHRDRTLAPAPDYLADRVLHTRISQGAPDLIASKGSSLASRKPITAAPSTRRYASLRKSNGPCT